MKVHKNDLSRLSTEHCERDGDGSRRSWGDVEVVLAGSLVEQIRRCGKPGCHCAEGDPHGPYAYFAPKTAGRGRSKYVPANLVARVQAGLARGEQVEAVLAEISAINAELLARRELT